MKITLVALALARALDAGTTCHVLHRGGAEANPLLPGGSCKAVVAAQGAIATGEAYGLARFAKRHPRLAQGLAWGTVSIEGWAAFHNVRVK